MTDDLLTKINTAGAFDTPWLKEQLRNWDASAELRKAQFMDHFEINEDSPSGLIWKKKTSKFSNKKVGSTAGSLQKDKRTKQPYEYWVVEFKGKRYPASHIVWYLSGNTIPKGMEVDHKDNNPKNNKLNILRLATRSEQNCNRRLKNVSFCKEKKKWVARISLHNKCRHLGAFNTKEEALACYDAAAKKLHGDFACLTI